MSGPGDIDGEVSGDEAAWRDLIARFDVPADRTGASVPWPVSEDLPESPVSPADTAASSTDGGAGPAEPRGGPDAGRQADQHGGAATQPASPATRFANPADRTRVIRPAGDPRAYTPAEEQDEPYVPEPLPPPARMDSVTKAALAGVIGGPGYLLIASLFLHWTISPAAAFVAVAAFIAGFVTLVVKLGDRSGRDDDDNGAVL